MTKFRPDQNLYVATYVPELLNGAASDPNNPFTVRKDSRGVVYLAGRVTNLVDPVATFCTLPPGFRPFRIYYVCWVGGVAERGFNISQAGVITPPQGKPWR